MCLRSFAPEKNHSIAGLEERDNVRVRSNPVKSQRAVIWGVTETYVHKQKRKQTRQRHSSVLRQSLGVCSTSHKGNELRSRMSSKCCQEGQRQLRLVVKEEHVGGCAMTSGKPETLWSHVRTSWHIQLKVLEEAQGLTYTTPT